MTSEVGAQSSIGGILPHLEATTLHRQGPLEYRIKTKIETETEKPKKQNFGFYWMGRVAARAKICVLVFSFSVF